MSQPRVSFASSAAPPCSSATVGLKYALFVGGAILPAGGLGPIGARFEPAAAQADASQPDARLDRSGACDRRRDGRGAGAGGEMPPLYRVIVPVSDIDRAARFYAVLLGIEGMKDPFGNPL